MNNPDDIYAISGRIKNIVARQNTALSPAGNVLVNTYALMLKDLYDFSNKLGQLDREELRNLLASKESLPEYVIRISTPPKNKTLYEQVMKQKTIFETNEKALEHFKDRYEELGGDQNWAIAEASEYLEPEDVEIMRVSRAINMLNYLISKEKGENNCE